MTDPDLVGALKRIKSSLEHARLFGFDTVGNYRTACVQAEGDIEELLIDYGFQKSDERDADRNVHVHIDHQVSAGSGHNGNFRNRTYEQAKAVFDEEAPKLGYSPGKPLVVLMRITTITETLEKNR